MDVAGAHGCARFRASSALVVGGGTGIGAATAHRLAREGARVGVADLRLEDAAAVAGELPGTGHVTLAIDVLDTGSVASAVERFGAEVGGIDVVAHVAGGDTRHGDFEQTGDDVWLAMTELNLLGPVRVMRSTLPWLRRSRRGPAAVLVGSVNARASLGSEPYSAAKAALAPVVADLAAAIAFLASTDAAWITGHVLPVDGGLLVRTVD